MALFLKALLFIFLLYILYAGGRLALTRQATKRLETISAGFARDYYLGDPSQPELRYLALGDSTVVGVGVDRVEDTGPYRFAQALAERQGRHVHVYNGARSGARIGDLSREQLSLLSDFGPQIVTIEIGANDASHFTPASSYRSSWATINGALRDSGATAYVANTPDMALVPALPFPLNHLMAAQARKQNRIWAELAPSPPSTAIDLYGQGRLDARLHPSLYAPDRFHPSPAGYSRWADLFAQPLQP